jgi:ABC-type transport system substrate-binding protein
MLGVLGLASGCATTVTPSRTVSKVVAKGGVYRAATTSFGLSDNLDPTGEDQVGFAFEIYAATLSTLVGFPHGNKMVPELATSIPTPTDNGLTYTFHLRGGIRFAPPVNTEITSSDIAYAFQRINDATLVPQYGYYYDGLIQGLTGTATNPNVKISGISTPNATTIVFHLTHAQGDFLELLAQPAAAPVPQKVAECFLQPGTYGRDMVASGPYMIQGSAAVNISTCATIIPMSGFNPTSHLNLVRNPNYSPSIDGTPDYLNGVEISIDTNASDIFDKIAKGQLDGSIYDIPPAVTVQHYLASSSLRKEFHSTPLYQSESITMNLAVAPFTNVHVRKAVEWVLDRSSIVTALGGTSVVSLATHVNPPGFAGSLPASYNPYASSGETGDLAKAKAQMKLSTFDPEHDGQCNVKACKGLVFINTTQYQAIDPIVQTDLAKIGIDIVPRVLSETAAFEAIFNVAGLVPMSALGGGGSDYTGANSFAGPNFATSAISGPSACCNYSLVGLTKAQAEKYKVPYPKSGIPSVDSLVNTCSLESGARQDLCFEKLDKVMMTKVVAWAPYMWGHYIVITAPTVTKYVANEIGNSVSLTQMAVDNHVEISS